MSAHRCVWLSLMGCMSLNLVFACKSRKEESRVHAADDYGSAAPMSTLDLHKFLKKRVDAQVEKKAIDDGANPREDIWDYYVDPILTSKQWGINIKNHRELFGLPLTSLRLPEGSPIPDVCPPANRMQVDGKPACLAADNLMRYMWDPKGKGSYKKDAKDWFVHLIPQFYGSKQPAMQRFLKDGDMIVYFHPERRGDVPAGATQWRTTHAATIIKRDSDGAVMTVDTPAGYAKPFNGVDATPFHVFRFVPRSYQDWSVVDEYGRQIARWGTLGFDQFKFEGNYGVMAGAMRLPADMDRFADNYIKSARDASVGQVLPNMYCAWFAWTNLNLGWMRPFSPSGLGDQRYRSLAGKKFEDARASHAFAEGDFDKGYAVPKSLQNRLTKKESFALMPMTAPELLLGFLDRVVGRTADVSSPQEFIGMAKVKAGMLAGILADPNNIRTIQNEARLVAQYAGAASPTPQQTQGVDEYNAKVITTIQTFAKLFEDLANAVASGQMDYKLALKGISDEFLAVVRREWTDKLDVSRKWIPPYGFMHHAEYGYENYNVQEKGHPVLVYVGTVMHEKFLRKKGEKPGNKPLSMIAPLEPSAQDLALDQEIYKALGCEVQNDGNGWKALLQHLKPNGTAPCGRSPRGLEKLTQAEFDALVTMLKDWEVKSPPSERDIFIRNTFGLDPVIARRLLASYWNDPTKAFKVSLYEGEASTIDTAVLNIRILLSTDSVKLNPAPAESELYLKIGHPRRKTAMPCLAFTKVESGSCRRGAWATAFRD
jgi:hypothetical protein